MRYKEFNKNRVLEKCITLFWNKGFGACSINDIVKETGVNRFSLYNEFENKEGILSAALKLYNQRYSSIYFSKPQKSNSVHEDILALFLNFLPDNQFHPPGCFTIHIATELADHNEKIKDILDNYTIEIKSKFNSTLKEHLGPNSDTDFYAKHLTGLFCSSMCHCVIQTYNERVAHISTGIKVLLNKKTAYATHVKL